MGDAISYYATGTRTSSSRALTAHPIFLPVNSGGQGEFSSGRHPTPGRAARLRIPQVPCQPTRAAHSCSRSPLLSPPVCLEPLNCRQACPSRRLTLSVLGLWGGLLAALHALRASLPAGAQAAPRTQQPIAACKPVKGPQIQMHAIPHADAACMVSGSGVWRPEGRSSAARGTPIRSHGPAAMRLRGMPRSCRRIPEQEIRCAQTSFCM